MTTSCSKDPHAIESAWLGRDNIVEWVLSEDGTPLTDLSALTRAVVYIGSYTIDSDVEGSSVIWWTDSVTSKTLPDGSIFTGDVMRVKVGQKSMEAGEYTDCQLITYDASNTDGVTISDKINITVKESIA